MGLLSFFKKPPHREPARQLYAEAVAAARRPGFYESLGVADTVEGRFDMIALHVYLILRRLKSDSAVADLAQALFDTLFEDMDANLRNLGAGDITLGRKIRKLAEAFYGRIAAYDAGLAEADEAGLMDALDRNLYRKVTAATPALAAMAAYVRREDAALAAVPLSEFMNGRVAFGPPPSTPGAQS